MDKSMDLRLIQHIEELQQLLGFVLSLIGEHDGHREMIEKVIDVNLVHLVHVHYSVMSHDRKITVVATTPTDIPTEVPIAKLFQQKVGSPVRPSTTGQ